MKLYSFLLSIIILIQTCMPCADVHGTAVVSTQSTAHINTAGDEHAEGCADACSPFCQCSCCSNTGIPQDMAAPAEELLLPQDRVYLGSIPMDIVDISLPVWQPPQLV
jgi:hypothetical protein